jgi:WD40 repeat protein
MTGRPRCSQNFLPSILALLLSSCGTGGPPEAVAPADKTAAPSPGDSTPAPSSPPAPPAFKIKRTQTLEATASHAWGASEPIFGLGWIADKDRAKLVAVGKLGTVLIWDLSDGARLDREIRNSSSSPTTTIALGRRTQQLGIGQRDGKIAIADFSKGDTFRTIYITPPGAPKPIIPKLMAISADEKSLVVLGSAAVAQDDDDPPMLIVCDLAAEKVAISAQLNGSMRDLGAAAMSADGARMINASSGIQSLLVRSLPPAIGVNLFPQTWPTQVYSVTWPGTVSAMALSHNEQIAATGLLMGVGKPAKIWFHKTADGDSLSGVDVTSGEFLGKLTFSPNDRYLAAGKDSGAKAEIIDVQLLRTVAELDSPGRELEWSRDGRRLAVADGSRITIWETNE